VFVGKRARDRQLAGAPLGFVAACAGHFFGSGRARPCLFLALLFVFLFFLDKGGLRATAQSVLFGPRFSAGEVGPLGLCGRRFGAGLGRRLGLKGRSLLRWTQRSGFGLELGFLLTDGGELGIFLGAARRFFFSALLRFGFRLPRFFERADPGNTFL